MKVFKSLYLQCLFKKLKFIFNLTNFGTNTKIADQNNSKVCIDVHTGYAFNKTAYLRLFNDTIIH